MSANTANTVNVINSVIPLHHRPRRRPSVVADAVTTTPIPASPEQSPRHRRGNVTSITPETATSDADMRGLAIRYADAAPTKIGKSDVRKSFEFRNKGALLYVRALTKTWQTLVFISVNGAPAQWLEIEDARSRDTGGVVPREIIYGVDKLEASDRPVLVLDEHYLSDVALIQGRLGDEYAVVSASNSADISPLNGRDVILFGDDTWLQNAGNRILKIAASCQNLDIKPAVFRDLHSAADMRKRLTTYRTHYNVVCKDTFLQARDGLYLLSKNQQGELIDEGIKISAPFSILPELRVIEDDPDQNTYRKRIQFIKEVTDENGDTIEEVREAIVRVGTKTEIQSEIGRLRELGLSIDTRHENELASYLSTVEIKAPPQLGVKKFGWAKIRNKWIFVLPDQVITDGDDAVEVRNLARVAPKISSRGTLEDMKPLFDMCWQNHRLVFAIAHAFSAPLITVCPDLFRNLGGYNFAGKTSTGKTTLLAASAAMWGAGSTDETVGIIKSCSATVNGMENVASAASDTFLALDELGKAPAKTIADLAYDLANGVGKTRMARDGSARETKTWNTTFIATGEKSFEEALTQAGITPKGGQLLRFIDFDANAGAYGVFDEVGSLTPAKFSERIKKLSTTFYGTPAIKFLQALVRDRNAGTLEKRIADLNLHVRYGYRTDLKNGELERVNNKFALTAIAGELAIQYGALPWQAECCAASVRELYREYLQNSRILETSSDERLILNAFADFLDKYSSSASLPDIVVLNSGDDDRYQRTGAEGLLGVYHGYSHNQIDYHLFTSTVDTICAKHTLNKRLVKKILREKKILTENESINVQIANTRKTVRCWTLDYSQLIRAMGIED